MARLQPDKNQTPRYQEILRQSLEHRLALKKQKEEADYNYFGEEDSLTGRFKYTNFVGDASDIFYEIKHIDMQSIVYRIYGLSLPQEDGTWLTPEVIFCTNYAIKSVLEREVGKGSKSCVYMIYKTQTPDIVKKDDELIGCSSPQALEEQFKKFQIWSQHLDELNLLGMRAHWDIDEYLHAHTKKYYKVNDLKFRCHNYMLKNGYDVYSIRSIKVVKGKCFVSWVRKTGYIRHDVFSEKKMYNVPMFARTLMEEVECSICLHETLTNIQRQKNKNLKKLPYFYFEVLHKDEPYYYLISDGRFWYRVLIPRKPNKSGLYDHIRFPSDLEKCDFYVGKNWRGDMSLDYYHACYPLPWMRNTYSTIDYQYIVGKEWDLDSPLFPENYMNQLRSELDPTYQSSGQGFQPSNKST